MSKNRKVIAQSRILILIQATEAGRWLIFCQPVVHRLLSYGNDKHLRSLTDLISSNYTYHIDKFLATVKLIKKVKAE